MAKFTAQGKTFLITGGASGLGAQYAEVFLSQGAKSVAILDVAEATGKATTDRLNKIYNDKVTFIKCDVSKEDEIVKSFSAVVSKFKQIDVLINNAGIMSDAPALWRTACDVNWQGLVSLTFKGIKHMGKDEGGHGGTIINISSIAAICRYPYMPAYHASKLAVLHFTQCVAMEPFYERTGIRMLTIGFGPTDTPLLHNLETRAYDPKLGQEFAEGMVTESGVYQTVEAAVASVVHMFQNGEPGSIWLANDNKPVKDITADINRVFTELEELLA